MLRDLWYDLIETDWIDEPLSWVRATPALIGWACVLVAILVVGAWQYLTYDSWTQKGWRLILSGDHASTKRHVKTVREWWHDLRRDLRYGLD